MRAAVTDLYFLLAFVELDVKILQLNDALRKFALVLLEQKKELLVQFYNSLSAIWLFVNLNISNKRWSQLLIIKDRLCAGRVLVLLPKISFEILVEVRYKFWVLFGPLFEIVIGKLFAVAVNLVY